MRSLKDSRIKGLFLQYIGPPIFSDGGTVRRDVGIGLWQGDLLPLPQDEDFPTTPMIGNPGNAVDKP